VVSTPNPGPRVVVMGASGCGKSTVGSMLARLLEVPYVDADGLHPAANVATMAAGIPLTDADRWPWLRLVGAELAGSPRGAVVACSALRRPYRDVLRETAPGTVFVHLDGTRDQLAARMAARLDHFMPPSLLDTQLATLERLQPDEAGVVLDIAATPDRLAVAAASWVRCRRTLAAADDVPAGGTVAARRR
jgi:gluconokinase